MANNIIYNNYSVALAIQERNRSRRCNGRALQEIRERRIMEDQYRTDNEGFDPLSDDQPEDFYHEENEQ